MANKVSEEKKEFARVLYMSGEQQNIIAEKVGVSKQTINRWVAEEHISYNILKIKEL